MRPIIAGASTGILVALAVCRFMQADHAAERAAWGRCTLILQPPPRCVLEVYGMLPQQTSATCRPEGM